MLLSFTWRVSIFKLSDDTYWQESVTTLLYLVSCWAGCFFNRLSPWFGQKQENQTGMRPKMFKIIKIIATLCF